MPFFRKLKKKNSYINYSVFKVYNKEEALYFYFVCKYIVNLKTKNIEKEKTNYLRSTLKLGPKILVDFK